MRGVLIALLVLVLSLGAAGCGKKGDVEDPKDEKVKFPRQYPR